jgi:hypothetical protein
MDDYQSNLALRGQQYAESKQPNKYTDEEDEDEDANG